LAKFGYRVVPTQARGSLDDAAQSDVRCPTAIGRRFGHSACRQQAAVLKRSDTLPIVSVILIAYSAFAEDFTAIGKAIAATSIVAILAYMYLERRRENSRPERQPEGGDR
jgi:hypothetical protein